MNLSDEFPRSAISWRAQSVTKAGDKALALAYIDARDVMRRLDEAVGPDSWSDSYVETPSGRLICTIAILCGEQWVSKSDGAGDTDVEGAKGAISDSFKRCAVKWGIGRYLYDLDAPWVPCETYERNGKQVWSRWKEDPWRYVKGTPEPVAETKKDIPFPQGPCRNLTELKTVARDFWRDVEACDDLDQMAALLATSTALVKQLQDALPDWWTGGCRANGDAYEGLGEVITRVQSGLQANAFSNPLAAG